MASTAPRMGIAVASLEALASMELAGASRIGLGPSALCGELAVPCAAAPWRRLPSEGRHVTQCCSQIAGAQTAVVCAYLPPAQAVFIPRTRPTCCPPTLGGKLAGLAGGKLAVAMAVAAAKMDGEELRVTWYVPVALAIQSRFRTLL